MKYRNLLLLLGAIIVSPARLLIAGALYEGELEQLRKQHDEAVAAAVEPLDRRYRAALEQLLRRATQNSDLDAALKIKERLAAFPESPSAMSPPSGQGGTSPTAIEKALVGAWDLTLNNRPSGFIVFKADGTFGSGYNQGKYKISTDGGVTLTNSVSQNAVLRISPDLSAFTGTYFDGTVVKGKHQK